MRAIVIRPVLACAAAVAPVASLAHAPGAAGGIAPWATWNTEAWLVWLLALSALFYAAGLWRLWTHAGVSHGIAVSQVAAFAGGWLSLVVALVSPLDALGSRLFSAHMLQHELLMVVAAPLLVLGRPLAAWAWALSPRYRLRLPRILRGRPLSVVWDAFTQPLAAWALHAIALWAWHVPRLFEAALHSEAVHVLQHASFFVTAVLFWWAVLGRDGRSGHSGRALAYLFTTMMHTSALGALLTLAPTPWYPDYAATSGALGLDPVEDQQLGGLVMWVPGGFVYVAAALAAVAQALRGGRHFITRTQEQHQT